MNICIIVLNLQEKGDYFKTHWTVELKKKAMGTAEEIVSVYTILNFQPKVLLVLRLLYIQELRTQFK